MASKEQEALDNIVIQNCPKHKNVASARLKKNM